MHTSGLKLHDFNSSMAVLNAETHRAGRNKFSKFSNIDMCSLHGWYTSSYSKLLQNDSV